jgi:hypothetical protein
MCGYRNELDDLIIYEEFDKHAYEEYEEEMMRAEERHRKYLLQRAEDRKHYAGKGLMLDFRGEGFTKVIIEEVDGKRALVRIVDFDGYLNQFLASSDTLWVALDDWRFGD